jgi:hypothetical protein
VPCLGGEAEHEAAQTNVGTQGDQGKRNHEERGCAEQNSRCCLVVVTRDQHDQQEASDGRNDRAAHAQGSPADEPT